jgi:recombination protein RecR
MKEAGPLDILIRALAGLPGLGPRSARRIALHLLTAREKTLYPLISALQETERAVRVCGACGNLDTTDPCRICRSESRTKSVLCVVASVADLWAIERTGAYKGLYHCLGGVLSALDGMTPDMLRIQPLIERVRTGPVAEIILALSATVDGQATAHYLTDRLQDAAANVRITRLAHGVPVGGELDYLDDGTIATALKSRASL